MHPAIAAGRLGLTKGTTVKTLQRIAAQGVTIATHFSFVMMSQTTIKPNHKGNHSFFFFYAGKGGVN